MYLGNPRPIQDVCDNFPFLCMSLRSYVSHIVKAGAGDGVRGRVVPPHTPGIVQDHVPFGLLSLGNEKEGKAENGGR